MGLARIRLEAGGSRTVVPDISKYFFVLTFTPRDPSYQEKTVNITGGTLNPAVALEPGFWELNVKGYSSQLSPVPAVEGSASGYITAGEEENFKVSLRAAGYSSGGTGSLDYDINFPENVRAILSLRPLDVSGITSQTFKTFKDIDISDPGGTASDTISGLPAGAYLAVVDLYDTANNMAAVWTRGVHIYGNAAAASLSHTFAEDDFAECPDIAGEGKPTLAAKLDEVPLNSSGTYTVVLNGNETDLTFTPKTLNATNGANITIILRGNGSTVQLDNTTGSLFTVGASSGSLTLVLQDLTLQGVGNNSSALVTVGERGTLEMKAGSLITRNSNANGTGGGVYVSGTLTMHGGAVSDNSAGYGGGVYVDNGTFTMHGGGVSKNSGSSGSSGAKVAVYGGTFTLSGDAWLERVFLVQNGSTFGSITIDGSWQGGDIAVDLGITSNSPITAWEGKPILKGDLISMDHFILGDMKRTDSFDPEEPITGYKIDGSGNFVEDTD
jgi:hypothetical protein